MADPAYPNPLASSHASAVAELFREHNRSLVSLLLSEHSAEAKKFGYEEAFLGVECKRVAHGNSSLNQRYVTHGVSRFVTGQYAAGHH